MREEAWGYERQLIGWSTLVDLTVDKLVSGSNDINEIQLAGVRKNEASQAGELLQTLANAEPKELDSFKCRKWRFLVLAWLYDNKAQFADPLTEVELVYADFEYPHEIASFVRFMPTTDGYDPRQFSKPENEKRLFDLWQKYLTAAGLEFGMGAKNH
jgi:hypothetical protein